MNNKALNIVYTVLALFVLITIAYFIASPSPSGAEAAPPPSISEPDVPLRYLAVLIGAIGMGVVYYFTRESEAWELGMQKVIYGVVGAAVYAVAIWVFSGKLFKVPAVSDVGLRPGVVFPVLFGYLFGPLAGFMTGGFGNIVGDALSGFRVSPEWDMGNAIIGFVAGMHFLFANKKRSLDVASSLAVAIGVLAAIGYATNPTVLNQFGEGAVSPWLGYSVLAGVALCLAIRFGFPDKDWGEIVVWGALGNLVGLGLASIADIWINAGKLTPVEAVIGQFIPAAGPNLIAVAVLMPILIVSYGAVQQQEAT
ncbi:MAG: ECF transporter S component [Chloroflexi bacterium]|nr:ECF transporter S component [Chloroflexota bacterium]